MTERLQKLLARNGHGSRRQIEDWIRQGLITVNGRLATLGEQASAADQIRLGDKPLRLKAESRPRVLMYHKREGVVTTRRDPQGRPTVFDSLPVLPGGRWITVGRLDIATSGLLLLTNQGELAHALMHPSNQLEREYAVRVTGRVADSTLETLVNGVELADGPARFEEIQYAGGSGTNHWYHAVVVEGRNREVRRLWESQGIRISRLIRVRFGPVMLPRWLRPGTTRELERATISELQTAAGLAKPLTPQSPKRATKGRRVPKPHR